MKKIVSLFAFVAIMISFAACGGKDGNVPEVKGFTFEVQTLSTKRHYVITPTNPNAYYIWNGFNYDVCKENQIQSSIEASLASGSFKSLIGTSILKGKSLDRNKTNQSPDTKYILYACYVEEDPVTHKGKMVGTPEYVIYQTMPEYTLNGEFTVDENGKKVRFSQGNLQKKNGTFGFFENQWGYNGSSSNDPIDLFKWDTPTKCPSPFSVLSRDEWWYVLKDRPNAEHLFAHATVNDVHGLILLPDNWLKPEGIDMTFSVDMGMNWDEQDEEYIHSNDNFDGYAVNTYNATQWSTLEFSGAVFLPAAKSYEGVANSIGWYWSSTIHENNNAFAHAFDFIKNKVDLETMNSSAISISSSYCSIRPVREVTE